MRNILIGILLGALTTVGVEAVSKHYLVSDDGLGQKCVSEATDTTRVSMPLTADGELHLDQAVCWPDGIEGEADAK